jgi:hypothetical protein
MGMTTQWGQLSDVTVMTLDYRTGAAEIVFTDGRVAAFELPAGETPDADWSSIDLGSSTVTVQFPDIPPMTAELGRGGESDKDLLRSRPVVYLDQLHWITLADRLHSPDSIPQSLRAPADKLIELARAERIVLPR